ncbi:MAG TPA: 16S rRNA (guanine(527)-N(7))-methyltransferase RsmG [Candidatus Paceibacterota bacterium]
MEELLKYAEKLSIADPGLLAEKLETYLRLLLEWNEKFNLTSITEPKDVWIKHFLDSLTILEAIPKNAKKIIDIGSGAGFPGIVVALVRPDIDMTLIEAIGKKVKFLEEVITVLEIKNAKAVNGRAEILNKERHYREKYDVALARAVALLPVLWRYAEPLLKKGGILIAQKKSGGSKEIEKSLISKVIPINIPSLPNHELVVIEKL